MQKEKTLSLDTNNYIGKCFDAFYFLQTGPFKIVYIIFLSVKEIIVVFWCSI